MQDTHSILYPLTFSPIFKEVIWGGHDILPFKGLEATAEKIGESWEISHVEGNVSVVNNGDLAGISLEELIQRYPTELLGAKVYERFGERFPLLIKFIDAKDNLSIQVHPDDKLAGERHNSFGKTEMWYVVKASADAALYSGFSQQSSPEDYVQRINEGSIMDVMQRYDVHAGNVFFLPAGRVHAIGAGCFVAEIQQTSNITYRIYDFDRTDAQGNKRELHTELAKDAIDYTLHADYRTQYEDKPNTANPIVSCQYFETNLLHIDRPLARNYESLDSFVIYIVMEGALSIKDNQGSTLELKQGQSVLLPAQTQQVELSPSLSCKLLETFIP